MALFAAASGPDDVRIHICEHLWPAEWMTLFARICRGTRDFTTRRDVRIGLFRLLPESAFMLTSPLWPLLRRGISLGAASLLEPAFEAMGGPLRDQVSHATGICDTKEHVELNIAGGRAFNGDGFHQARLLGRCLTLAVQQGSTEFVALALRCKADLTQRINGQSALDTAAQMGNLVPVELLLAARASPGQSAPSRWTPLMRAALGNHVLTCRRLLDADASIDDFSDRTTALDVAEANRHHDVAACLRERRARRFLELRADEKVVMPMERQLSRVPQAADTGLPARSAQARSSTASRRLRPGPHSSRGGLPRGVHAGSAVLQLRHLREDSGSDGEDASDGGS